jgi:hypothetical protein
VLIESSFEMGAADRPADARLTAALEPGVVVVAF